MSGHTVVLGAGGGIGHAIATQLVARGDDVVGVTRSGANLPAGVRDVRADATEVSGLIKACKGASVLHLAVNVPYSGWTTVLPSIVSNTLEAARLTGAKLVYADNLFAYGKVTGPITEQTPQRPKGRKETLRAGLARDVLAAHKDDQVCAVIGRSSDYYGPGPGSSLYNSAIFDRISRGKRPWWFGRLSTPHTLAYADDTARAMIVLADRSEGDGHIWCTPAAETLTGQQLCDLVRSVFCELWPNAKARKVKEISDLTGKAMGILDEQVREMAELSAQRDQPWVVDHSGFVARFGPLPVTPHRDAVAETLRYFHQRADDAERARTKG